MNGGFQCLRRLPLAYQKWVHLIAGLDHTKVMKVCIVLL